MTRVHRVKSRPNSRQIIGLKFVIWIASLFADMEEATWDDTILNGIEYLNKSVLQVPFLLMTLMRYVTPTLDEMYVPSLPLSD